MIGCCHRNDCALVSFSAGGTKSQPQQESQAKKYIIINKQYTWPKIEEEKKEKKEEEKKKKKQEKFPKNLTMMLMTLPS